MKSRSKNSSLKKLSIVLRPGFSLLEMILFLGILSIMLGTVISVFISTQETRVRQQGISGLEQRGTQVLEIITKTIRRAEQVILPVSGNSGSYIVLQLNENAVFPTIFSESGTGELVMVEKNVTSNLLNENIKIQNLNFQNTDARSIVVSFDLTTTFSLIQRSSFARHFESTVTLFPDDSFSAGGCESCPEPTCIDNRLNWYYCEENLCVLSGESIECS